MQGRIMGMFIPITSMIDLFVSVVVPVVASTCPPAQPEHMFLFAGQSNVVGYVGVRKRTNGQKFWDG